jgi:hypothetical protein
MGKRLMGLDLEPIRELPELRRRLPELRRRLPELGRELPELRRRLPELRRRPYFDGKLVNLINFKVLVAPMELLFSGLGFFYQQVVPMGLFSRQLRIGRQFHGDAKTGT